MRRVLLGSAVALGLIASVALARQADGPPATQNQTAGTAIPGIPIAPAVRAVVNFADLARVDEQRLRAAGPNQQVTFRSPKEHEYREPDVPLDPSAARAPRDVVIGPSIPSPSPVASFLGLDDIPQVGTGTSVIPPDTQGAVGLTRVLTSLNNNYRIHDKTTGAVISTVSIDTFWSSVAGVADPFDPKAVYDPYNNRFVVAAVSNAASTTSTILVGVSSTSDPGGTWTLYGFAACSGGAPCDEDVNNVTDWWADYPTLGFNQNWAAVSVNMFTTSTGAFRQSRFLAVNYPELLAGTPPSATFFTGIPDFTVVPAVTYSSSATTLYAPNHLSSAGRTYRLNTISGTPAAPVYTQGVVKTHSLISAWAQPNLSPDIVPQPPEPGTGAIRGIDSGDARILGAVFRNNAIWYAQTVGLPAGTNPATRTSAQWVKLNTSGDALDAGRVEDPTATSNNGGKWYAYPSIAVNAADGVLFGFSEFSSSQFPSAGYTFRASGDAAGSMREVVISKAGEGFYHKTYSGSENRWGDYSATQVDPCDDDSLWTIQQYSNPPVGTGNGSGRWSTWWAMVATHAAPTISAIADQSTPEDTSTGAIAFTVGDAETPAGSLLLSASSSNTTLVPNANIVFGGSGASRTVTVTPAANQFGTATITVTVIDGCVTTSDVFVLTVTAVDDAPTISAIPNQATTGSTAVGPIGFTVGDAETSAASLIVSGSSSNTAIVPNANIVFGGSGASRTVTVTPTSQAGTATITVTVSDGVLSAQTSFLLTVTSFTDDPLTSAITIKAVHVTELRTRIDAIRGARGLKPYTWTDPTLSPGSTVVRAVHVLDLRAALAEAYVAAKLTPPTYTDPGLTAGTTIRAVHIAEIRAAIVAIE